MDLFTQATVFIHKSKDAFLLGLLYFGFNKKTRMSLVFWVSRKDKSAGHANSAYSDRNKDNQSDKGSKFSN